LPPSSPDRAPSAGGGEPRRADLRLDVGDRVLLHETRLLAENEPVTGKARQEGRRSRPLCLFRRLFSGQWPTVFRADEAALKTLSPAKHVPHPPVYRRRWI